jgi:hypothetical protein
MNCICITNVRSRCGNGQLVTVVAFVLSLLAGKDYSASRSVATPVSHHLTQLRKQGGSSGVGSAQDERVSSGAPRCIAGPVHCPVSQLAHQNSTDSTLTGTYRPAEIAFCGEFRTSKLYGFVDNVLQWRLGARVLDGLIVRHTCPTGKHQVTVSLRRPVPHSCR